jgi:ketosteroid isomerase-like protein
MAQDTQTKADHMIRTVEDYFAAMDAFDFDGVLQLMTPDCTLRILTGSEAFRGRDTGIVEFLRWRADNLSASWHGDFRHSVNVAEEWIFSRFGARRTMNDKTVIDMDNVNFTEFRREQICSVTIWMAQIPGLAEDSKLQKGES